MSSDQKAHLSIRFINPPEPPALPSGSVRVVYEIHDAVDVPQSAYFLAKSSVGSIGSNSSIGVSTIGTTHWIFNYLRPRLAGFESQTGTFSVNNSDIITVSGHVTSIQTFIGAFINPQTGHTATPSAQAVNGNIKLSSVVTGAGNMRYTINSTSTGFRAILPQNMESYPLQFLFYANSNPSITDTVTINYNDLFTPGSTDVDDDYEEVERDSELIHLDENGNEVDEASAAVTVRRTKSGIYEDQNGRRMKIKFNHDL